MTAAPKASIIVPVFHSQATLASSLRSFRQQDYPDFEVIVIDSSADDACQRIVHEQFPDVVYHHAPERLLPHAGRNKGAALASGRYFLFTDPDIYAPKDWLSWMVETQRNLGGAVVSPLECYAPTWFALGIHIAKFYQVLPSKRVRPAVIGATAGLLCRREDYIRVGGFADNLMLGDTLFSWQLLAAGIPMYLNAGHAAHHHHLASLSDFLRERFSRGQDFAELTRRFRRRGTIRQAAQIIATLLPLRLVKWMARTGRHAWQAGRFSQFILVSPLVLAGHAWWLAGEASAYLLKKRPR